MKLNKTLALAALVAGSLFASGVASQAQDSTNTPAATKPATPKPRGFNVDFLAKQLNLTDDEKPKVKAAFEDQQQKLRDLHTDTSLSAEDKRAKMKELRDGLDTKMKGILTSEQYTKWEKIGPGHRRPMPGMPASTNAPAAK